MGGAVEIAVVVELHLQVEGSMYGSGGRLGRWVTSGVKRGCRL